MTPATIVWFRRDLRCADNEALTAAAAAGGAVVPAFVHASGAPARGHGERAWLDHSLASLDAGLRACGSRLVLREGTNAGDELARLARECGASAVHCTRDWSPAGLATERAAGERLAETGVRLEVFEGSLLVTPDSLSPASGSGVSGYRVFSPYFAAWERAWAPHAPLPAPVRLRAPARWPSSAPLSGRRSGADGAPDPTTWWRPGEPGAGERLAAFTDGLLGGYAEARDVPGVDGTSRLSPHLAFGELSPRQVVAAVRAADGGDGAQARAFVRQLAWREFAAHVVWHHPRSGVEPLRPAFARMPWRDDPDALEAWRQGRTGHPLVDAGMRQLASTGWMHNRVRMVAASFLAKDLLIDWTHGLAHFADLLTDHHEAANAFNWQWVAGSGADAAPYFRVFNPALQATRHDPDGTYIRAWVPELAEAPARWIARPWELPAEEARRAGVAIGSTYPAPIVDHVEARRRALAAYASIRGG